MIYDENKENLFKEYRLACEEVKNLKKPKKGVSDAEYDKFWAEAQPVIQYWLGLDVALQMLHFMDEYDQWMAVKGKYLAEEFECEYLTFA